MWASGGWKTSQRATAFSTHRLLNTAPYSIPDAGQKTKWRTAGNIYTYKQRVTQIHTQRENYTIEIDRPGAKKYEMKNTSTQYIQIDPRRQTHRHKHIDINTQTHSHKHTDTNMQPT